MSQREGYRMLVSRAMRTGDLSWITKDAACFTAPVDYWFVEKDQEFLEREGLRICWTCPIRRACLEHAMTRPEKSGTWGGTTPKQRGRFLKPILERHGMEAVHAAARRSAEVRRLTVLKEAV